MSVKAKFSKGQQIFIIFFSFVIIIVSSIYGIFFIYKGIYLEGIIMLIISIIWFFITKKNIYYLRKTGRLTGKITRKGKIIDK